MGGVSFAENAQAHVAAYHGMFRGSTHLVQAMLAPLNDRKQSARRAAVSTANPLLIRSNGRR